MCPGDSTSHSDGLYVVTKHRRQRRGLISQGFRRLGSLAPHPSRNVTPPGLSSPGPSVVVRYLPTLAAYPGSCRVRVKISGRAWTRPGRIRPHQFSFPAKIAPFETQPTTPAAHAQPEAPAREPAIRRVNVLELPPFSPQRKRHCPLRQATVTDLPVLTPFLAYA